MTRPDPTRELWPDPRKALKLTNQPWEHTSPTHRTKLDQINRPTETYTPHTKPHPTPHKTTPHSTFVRKLKSSRGSRAAGIPNSCPSFLTAALVAPATAALPVLALLSPFGVVMSVPISTSFQSGWLPKPTRKHAGEHRVRSGAAPGARARRTWGAKCARVCSETEGLGCGGERVGVWGGVRMTSGRPDVVVRFGVSYRCFCDVITADPFRVCLDLILAFRH